jgi:hypothetical protein
MKKEKERRKKWRTKEINRETRCTIRQVTSQTNIY